MKTRSALIAALMFFSFSAARAQGGCDNCMPCTNSPECPTAVLAAVGAAGVGLARRFNAHKK